MASPLASLLLDFRVNNAQLQAGLAAASASLQRFAEKTAAVSKQVAQASGRIAMVGGVLTGLGAIMVREAAKFDGRVAAAVNELKGEFSALAVEVGRALVPALQLLSGLLARVVEWFRSLSPATKELIGQFAVLTVGVTALAGITSKVATLVAALAPLAAAVAPALPVILAVGAALAALFVAASVLRTAWDENWGGMREKVAAVVAYYKSAFTELAGLFLSVTSFIGAVWSKVWGALQEVFMRWLGSTLVGIVRLGAVFGQKWAAPAAAAFATVKDMADRGLGGVVDDLGKGFSEMWRAFKEGAARNIADVKGMLGGLLGGGGGGRGGIGHAASLSIGNRTGSLAGNAPAIDFAKEFGAKASSRMVEAGNRFIELLSSGFGRLSELIQAGLAGGPAAVVVNLLAGSEGFRRTVEILDTILQSLSDILGRLFEPLQPLIASLTLVVDAVGTALAPAFELLGAVIRPFVPVLVLVGHLLKALAPVFGILFAAMQAIQQPMMLLATVVLPPLFQVLKFVGVTILNIVTFFGGIWNSIVSTLIDFLFLLNSATGGVFAEALNAVGAGLNAMKVNTAKLKEDADALWNLTFEGAMAEAEAMADGVKAREEETKAIERVTESLSNVPQVFKTALARGQAAGVSPGRGPMLGDTNLYLDGKLVLASVRQQQSVANFRNSGSGLGG